ncbi:hypothetical protein O0I10_003822 [Lichtheimia ornata]|uniref:C2H2-type domain-containing protein n=1 Tax=Lichtheimia ornata TaxID=688661 RepID=A0AAD7XZN5_9FUNG|nr:uncharacterized protein O0I10_003822 [Lichtheimia ornata]KAJ8660365.1 hypothetical protein O0I10_003822 [Lichtheimia ornata]
MDPQSVSCTDQPRSTMQTLEQLDCCVAIRVAQVVKEVCIHQQGGLANADLVSRTACWAITFITDDPFYREYYYWLTIHQLSTYYTHSHHLPRGSSATATSMPTPPPTPGPQEAPCSPLTTSDVSSDGGGIPRMACHHCQRTFSRKDALKRHLKRTCTYNKKGYTSQHVFSAFE